MKRILAFLILSFSAFASRAYVGKVVDESGGAVYRAKVVLEKDGEILSVTTTDLDGDLNTIYTPGECSVIISAEGYDSLTVSPTGGNLGKLTLKRQTTELQEFAVTASNSMRKFDHTSYKLSKKQMERYATVYAALQEIPQMTFADGLRYRGSTDIKLLINGVESSVKEYMALSKEDISEIQVYDVPPPRYAAGDVQSVVNIVTRTDITGGNMFLMLNETPQPWARTVNIINGNYTYGKNRFGASYNNNFTRSDCNSIEEDIIYRTGKETISKHRDSFYRYNRNMEHDFKVSYLFSNPFAARPTQFNIDFHGNFINTMIKNKSDVTVTKGGNTDLTRSSDTNKDKIGNFDLSLYFHHKPTSKHLLLANVVATSYDTRNRSSYGEENPITEASLFNFNNSTDNNLYSIKGEFEDIIYNVGTGRFSTDLLYYWQRSMFESNGRKSHLERNEATLSFSYMLWVKNVYLLGKIAGNYQNLFNSFTRLTDSKFAFTPYVYMYWRKNSVTLTAVAMRYTTSPLAGELTPEIQYVDEGLRRSGNPNLKPFTTNAINVTQTLGLNHFQYSLSVNYKYAPKMIVPDYFVKDDYILESYGNASDVHRFDAALTVVYSPLAGLNFSGFFLAGQYYIKTRGENWRIPTYRFNLSASYSTAKWDFSVSYQFPGRDGLGVIKRRRIQSLNLYAAFKPNPDLAVGIDISSPFMKCEERRSSVDGTPVYFEETSRLRSMESGVSLQLIWNLNFGRRKIENNRNLDNRDNDSGRLRI